uniref:Dynein heavy chain, cytoplasmic n=1 Tax=Percolomonas cosmopolitus TaxID=63605 RepID=A0A7S1KNU3_9EUKA
MYHQMLTSVIEPHLRKQIEHDKKENTDILQNLENFSVSLYQCQQEFNIPELNVQDYIHPVVQRLNSLDDFQPNSQILNEIEERLGHLSQKMVELSTTEMAPEEITSSTKEIEYWKTLESVMMRVLSNDQMESPKMQLTLSILKANGCFRTLTPLMEHRNNLEYQAKNKAEDYVQLLKSVPIRDLLNAPNIRSLTDAISRVFSAIGRIRSSNFPVKRAKTFLECVSEEMKQRLLTLLRGIMSLSYDDFQDVTNECANLFAKWSSEARNFEEIAKQAANKRHETQIDLRNCPHEALQKRIEKIRQFRKEHHEFQVVIDSAFTPNAVLSVGEDIDASMEMQIAYDFMKEKGDRLFEATDEEFETYLKEYNEKVDSVETYITRVLKEELGMAHSPGKSSNEMFRVFRKYNVLFYKPKIFGSVQEYQAELITKVQNDIKALQQKFMKKYVDSETRHISLLRDIPDVSGAIIWAAEIERQLDSYMKRVEDVYGLGWERLQLLRRDYTWTLNESLADFMGTNLYVLQNSIDRDPNMSKLKPEATGTAFALAFLQIVYEDSRNEWATTELESEKTLYSYEKHARLKEGSILEFAQKTLKNIGVGERHTQEKSLREECAHFKKKIREGIDARVDKWNEDITHILGKKQWKIIQIDNTDLKVEGPIFTITQQDSSYVLNVNFHPGLSEFVKEYRFLSLSWLNMKKKVNPLISKASVIVMEVYPMAISLQESVRSFYEITSRVNKDMQPLVDSFVRDVVKYIDEGFKQSWSKIKVEYTADLSQKVYRLNEEVNTLTRRMATVEFFLTSLENQSNTVEALTHNIKGIQDEIDAMNLASYPNLDMWVRHINTKIAAVLMEKLNYIIQHWMEYFVSEGTTEDKVIHDDDPQKELLRLALPSKRYRIEIKIDNGEMFADPSEYQARMDWYERFHQCLAVLLKLPMLQSGRYDNTLDQSTHATETQFLSLVEEIPGDLLTQAYKQIDVHVAQLAHYIQDWLKYQALWEMDDVTLFNMLGDDLSRWVGLIKELIEGARTQVNSSETYILFGQTSVHFKAVSKKIRDKYNTTLQSILREFKSKLNEFGNSLYNKISSTKEKVQKVRVESNIDDAIQFLTLMREIQRNHEMWKQEVEQYCEGEKILRTHQIDLDFTQEQIEGKWEELNQIIAMRNEKIKSIKNQLIEKIYQDDKSLAERLDTFEDEWNMKKPDKELITPEEALNRVMAFEAKFDNLCEAETKIHNAQEVLDLEVTVYRSSTNPDKTILQTVEEEIDNLKSVWTKLKTVYSALDDSRDVLFQSVIVRQFKDRLSAFLQELKDSPSWMHTYESFRQIRSKIENYVAAVPVLKELKTEAMADRHWKMLRKNLNANWELKELTVGQILDTDIETNEQVYKDVLRVAQGELVLEVHLREIQDKWNTFQVDLTNYHNKCFLIRGWDDLFDQVNDHLNSLISMRSSPYFKTFKERCVAWEKNLNDIRMISDLWLDVQRTWVYLEGIFTGNKDIKQQLPTETAKFNVVNNTFKSLMRKVQSNPLILEIIAIPNCLKTLEGLHTQLQRVQKSLGEYLEKQRAAFPRFYFVGDEDLLEIIGNADDPEKIQKHLKKMFAGINSLEIASIAPGGSYDVTALVSREGEKVSFKDTVKIDSKMRINEWLAAIERQMRETLGYVLDEAVPSLAGIYTLGNRLDLTSIEPWITTYPAQIVVLAVQIMWTRLVEQSIQACDLSSLLTLINQILEFLASRVLEEHDSVLQRRKIEYLITELVHQRDVVRLLEEKKIASTDDFSWLYYLRYYHNPNAATLEEKVSIRIANASFSYGYEYLGLIDKLVQTPLTDRCYLALTQALHSRMGGSPFGPAGTGKTETVKSLANAFGRFVLVFCCDENFDYKAMGRIFVGICMCGAWGCFDEFNRLQEKILSAVSQQILSIQTALRNESYDIELIERNVRVDPNTGVFITMNPGYAGRSNLPDNLKQLFRSIAMVKPDRELIAQVIMYSQGFNNAEKLASKVVLFFELSKETLSSQSHYDFGLRALKTVLVNAGLLKRLNFAESSPEKMFETEQSILIQSIVETMVPKLVGGDEQLLRNLVSDIFPGIHQKDSNLDDLKQAIRSHASDSHLVCAPDWEQKVIQLYQIQNLSHGIILVGPAGCGKTSCWRTLVTSLEDIEKKKANIYVIDPKSLSKSDLYGSLDATTREWTDGIFTHTLRKIVDSVRGEQNQRHWIVFDGDVDPEWVENLNSVLDDNKIFTLPNGERVAVPHNVRLLFEVRNLDYATLATVSRCGMIWFSPHVVTLQMRCTHFLDSLRNVSLDTEYRIRASNSEEASPALRVQQYIASILETHFDQDTLLDQVRDFAQKQESIMDYCVPQSLVATFDLLKEGISNIHEYNLRNNDFPLENDIIQKYMEKRLVFSLFWGFGSIMIRKSRIALSEFICAESPISPPAFDDEENLLDYSVRLEDGTWVTWKDLVPDAEVDQNRTASNATVIPTPDTLRHEELLLSWIHNKRNAILCGPPGSGKTMILTSVLKSLPNYESVSLNFSSATGSDLIMKTLEQYCVVTNGPNGFVMRPSQDDKRLVIFCDEINLPANDDYGTQLVITFMRQVIEQGGFWRACDHTWIQLERVVFVGACNPPTDPGRVIMTPRFLRHCPVLFVDFPNSDSLLTIYHAFNKSLFKEMPALSGFVKPTTEAMVDLFSQSQTQFTADMQPHYIYSPRELSRWVRALYVVFKKRSNMTVDEFIKLFVHEGLRIFADRLVHAHEREWTYNTLDTIVCEKFNADHSLLKHPILFSDQMTKDFVCVQQEELRDYLTARLKTFSEEELEVKLVLFDSVLEHILRIDRVLKQPLGHMLLAGVSGAGKTILSKFVSWLNGYSVFQIKAHKNYTLTDFEEDLRDILKRAGCKRETICFIFDEANALESSFLEYMNSLLASGEVPGLFEDEELTNLLGMCKTEISSLGILNIDTDEEVYQWFVSQVQQNLHVVFTINPANSEFKDRAATSPALFNRCVVDWFGDWSQEALMQVASEYTKHMPLQTLPGENEDVKHQILVNTVVQMHNIVRDQSLLLSKQSGRKNHVTPRHFLDFLLHFLALHREKMQELQDQQIHINRGLQALRSTEEEVSNLQATLKVKKEDLAQKNKQADEKLKIIVKDKQLAQTKKDESLQLAQELDSQSKDINERKTAAEEDLQKVQPQLEEAQMALKEIKKRHLDELRNLGNPPTLIKTTLEAVCIMLKKKASAKYDWVTIRKLMRSDTFIKEIIEFDSNDVTEKMRRRLQKEFLPDIPYEAVKRASVACGPMVKWLESQISYSVILAKVDPLKKEVEELEIKTASLRERQSELQMSIQEIETSIQEYEVDYEELLKQTQQIKLEIQTVNTKVERSTKLLKSLGSETVRWQEQSTTFDVQMESLIGDVLLSGAFLTYIGYFDEYYRKVLLDKWSDALGDIKFKEHFDITSYLSTSDKQSEWQSNGLPVDDLCTQNAIIMERFNRYPLIIDPTGQAVEFLMNQMRHKKIVKTSFVDPGFLKSLESCLRWGTPLLVQDAEALDPILNPILNREFRRVGGRTLVGVGNQDIDVSEEFTIFLSSRDPTYMFPADLSSRVTFVNFTVTPSSLQAQCLGIILKHERPEIDKQRSEQLKLQSEYKVRLRSLETSLLNSISESKGNLLDNEELIGTLENLKQSSSDIQTKVEQVEEVMRNLSQVSAVYNRVSALSSKAFFALEQLSELHFLYHFSLGQFMDVVDYILRTPSDLADSDESRVEFLSRELFRVLYSRTSRSMLHKDQLSFALRLTQIFLEGTPDDIPQDEMDLFIKSGVSLHSSFEIPAELTVSTAQKRKLIDIAQLNACSDLERHLKQNISEWNDFLSSTSTKSGISLNIPQCFDKNNSSVVDCFRKMLLVSLLRPSHLDSFCFTFVDRVFGKDFLNVPELNLNVTVEKDLNCYTPLLLASMPGSDASEKIKDLSFASRKVYKSIAMGTVEAYNHADTELKSAMQRGTWVQLKNVHLSPAYLSQLEKHLHEMKLEQRIHKDFRLFLTSELHPNLPSNIIRLSYVIVFETPTGIKASLMRSFSNLTREQVNRAPAERSRLHFLVSWLHALIQERQRYIPLGWSKKYEFSESDSKWAIDTVDSWVDKVAGEQSHMKPERVPWKAITSLLSQSVYGGKIDNEFDQMVLQSLLDRLFIPESYNPDFSLISEGDLMLPEDTSYDSILEWIQKMPPSQPPHYLGLPLNVKTMIQKRRAKNITRKLAKIQNVYDEQLEYGENKDESQSVWRKIMTSVTPWLSALPEELVDFKFLSFTSQQTGSHLNPLLRSLDRELKTASDLLAFIRKQLKELVQISNGELKPNNIHWTLRENISKQTIPKKWCRYPFMSSMTLSEWILDFAARVKQLDALMDHVCAGNFLGNFELWLGGLLFPNAFISATRQFAAEEMHVSLEQLEPKFSFQGDSNGKRFGLRRLTVSGATLKDSALKPSPTTDGSVALHCSLPLTHLEWVAKHAEDSQNDKESVPLYLNANRDSILMVINLPVKENADTMYERGIALSAWSHDV